MSGIDSIVNNLESLKGSTSIFNFYTDYKFKKFE